MQAALVESKFLYHEPCPSCGSKDNLARYADGGAHCFGCKYHEKGSGDAGASAYQSHRQAGHQHRDLLRGTVGAITNRRLDEDTCRLFDYQVGDLDNEKVHIANYRDRSGAVVAQKIRKAGKKFSVLGDAKGMGLFGDHLWAKGKRIVITEGEIDAMSVSQAMGNKWPVVSLPIGAQSAVKAIQKSYDYLDAFEEIVLMFDQDEPGREAATKVAEILPVGKVKIATLPLKDANECLVAGKVDAIVQAMWNAKPYRPDGIVMANDLKQVVMSHDNEMGLPYPFTALNRITRGIRPSELVVITSGSGMGKTTFVREIAHSLHTAGHKVGLIMLEESNKRTLQGLVGLHLNKNILVDRTTTSDEEISRAFDELFTDRDVALYDHFGSTDVDNIINRIRYMARALGCTHVVVDHLSILVSGLATGDERKLIDMAMTKLRTLVQETGISLFVISHLKRPDGNQGHEDGAKVHLGQLRGSHAIAQLADICIALQKPEGETTDSTELRILKNRFTGEVGSAGILNYNRDTGRLTESVF